MKNIISEKRRVVKMLVITVVLVFTMGAVSPSMAAEDTDDTDSKISSFGFTQKTIYVKQGNTVRLPFVAYAKERGEQVVKWEASATSIATVAKGKTKGEISLTTNQTSKLTIHAGKKIGQGKITLRADNVKVVVIIHVVKKTKPVKQKSLKIKGLVDGYDCSYLEFGQTVKLKPVFTKKATAIVTWKSSEPNVAKVNAAGQITGLTAGWTTITLKVGTKTKKLLVKVLEEGVTVTVHIDEA